MDQTIFDGRLGAFYDYLAGNAFAGVLGVAAAWLGGPRPVRIRFSHVAGFDHSRTTRPHIQAEVAPQLPDQAGLCAELKWVAATKYRESSVADLFAGCLHAAQVKDRYGDVEATYLRMVWHQLAGSHQCAIPWGLRAIPAQRDSRSEGWFPCSVCCPRRDRGLPDCPGWIH